MRMELIIVTNGKWCFSYFSSPVEISDVIFARAVPSPAHPQRSPVIKNHGERKPTTQSSKDWMIIL